MRKAEGNGRGTVQLAGSVRDSKPLTAAPSSAHISIRPPMSMSEALKYCAPVMVRNKRGGFSREKIRYSRQQSLSDFPTWNAAIGTPSPRSTPNASRSSNAAPRSTTSSCFSHVSLAAQDRLAKATTPGSLAAPTCTPTPLRNVASKTPLPLRQRMLGRGSWPRQIAGQRRYRTDVVSKARGERCGNKIRMSLRRHQRTRNSFSWRA